MGSWRGVDRRAAAINALRDYSTMQTIIDTTDDDLKAIAEDIPTVSSPKLDGMPGGGFQPPRGQRRGSWRTWSGLITASADTSKRRSKALEHLAILLYGRYSPRTAPNCLFLRNQKYRVSTVATDTIMG